MNPQKVMKWEAASGQRRAEVQSICSIMGVVHGVNLLEGMPTSSETVPMQLATYWHMDMYV
jgi:hypothetical protein